MFYLSPVAAPMLDQHNAPKSRFREETDGGKGLSCF